MCLPLVQTREVELNYGKCLIPCGKWKKFLKTIFELILQFGMQHLQTSRCYQEALCDPRIYQLGKELETRLVLSRIIIIMIIITPWCNSPLKQLSRQFRHV
jgi:hypothetical protein